MTWGKKAPTSARGYDGAWKTLRQHVLQEEPVCRLCRSAPSTQVDHITPLASNPQLRLVRANLQGVCAPCHRRKTGREHGRASRRRPDEPHPGEGAKNFGPSPLHIDRFATSFSTFMNQGGRSQWP